MLGATDPVAEAQAQLAQLQAQRASVQQRISSFLAPAAQAAGQLVQRVEGALPDAGSKASAVGKVAAFGLATGLLAWALGLPPFSGKKKGRRK